MIVVLEIVLFQNCFQEIQYLVGGYSVLVTFVKPKFSDMEDVFNGQVNV